MTQKLSITGSAVLEPPTQGQRFPTLRSVIDLSAEQYPRASRSQPFTLDSAVTWIDLLAGLNLTSATFLTIRVSTGSVELRVTTSAGTDQLFSFSDFLAIASSRAGFEWTSIEARGLAEIEIMIGGS